MDIVNEIWQLIWQMVMPVLAGYLILYGAALLKANLDRIGDEKLREFLERLVGAAEQIYGAGEGPAKLEYVAREATNAGQNFTRADIEAAVWNLWVPPVETPITETEDIE